MSTEKVWVILENHDKEHDVLKHIHDCLKAGKVFAPPKKDATAVWNYIEFPVQIALYYSSVQIPFSLTDAEYIKNIVDAINDCDYVLAYDGIEGADLEDSSELYCLELAIAKFMGKKIRQIFLKRS